MAISTYEDLIIHKGHKLECVSYDDENVTIECMTCCEVLVDYTKEQESTE